MDAEKKRNILSAIIVIAGVFAAKFAASSDKFMALLVNLLAVLVLFAAVRAIYRAFKVS